MVFFLCQRLLAADLYRRYDCTVTNERLLSPEKSDKSTATLLLPPMEFSDFEPKLFVQNSPGTSTLAGKKKVLML